MTIKLTEQPGSRAGKGSGDLNSNQTRIWHSSGSDDIDAIITALKAEAPTTITCPVTGRTLARNTIGYVPRKKKDLYELSVEYLDQGLLNLITFSAEQQRDSYLEIGEYNVTVSTTGGTAILTTSLQTVATYVSGDTIPPDFKQSINVTSDGDVQGVQAVIPAMQLSYEVRHARADADEAYAILMMLMTGTVNQAEWKTFPAGEVLFMGANVRVGRNSDPVWKYDFIRLPNITDQTIGDILVESKKGHEYMWVVFAQVEDPTAKKMVKRPSVVKIERIYPYSDFSQFLI